MTRETTQVTTPVSKQVLVLNTYITGREYEYVQGPLFEAMSVQPSVIGEMKMSNFNIAKVQESTHRLLEKVIVSIDGADDDALNKVLDMQQDDYQFVIDKVNELTKKK